MTTLAIRSHAEEQMDSLELDAVEGALDLPEDALDASRSVLARFGNMSSATLMFVLADMMDGPSIDHGVGLAFGPGLAAEGFAFQCA